jgi:alpha-glucosidase
MRWDASARGGFTTGHPWLPLGGDAGSGNVEAQRGDPGSLLALHRRLIALRRAEPALSIGDIAILEAGEHVLAYLRRRGGRAFLVALNLDGEPHRIALPAKAGRVRCVLSTDAGRGEDDVAEAVELRPREGIVLRLDRPNHP